MTIALIAAAAFAAWLLNTIGGGGGEFILILAVSHLLGAQAVAPVVTLGNLMGVPGRVLLFREYIEWRIVRWFLTGAVPGALLGAFLFTRTHAEWLQIVIAIFLISAPLQYRWGERERTFTMRVWWFLPAGFVVALLSGLLGGTGPVLNPLYLNYGAVKREMIGTKGFNALVMHAIKTGTYATFGALATGYVIYGVAAGIAALAGNWLGKRYLDRISAQRFRTFVTWLMLVSGVAMLWQQRGLIAALADAALR